MRRLGARRAAAAAYGGLLLSSAPRAAEPPPPAAAPAAPASGDCADCSKAVADSGRMRPVRGDIVVTRDAFVGRCKDGAYIYRMTNVSRATLSGRLVRRDGQYWIATLPPGQSIEIKSRVRIPGVDGRDFVGTWTGSC